MQHPFLWPLWPVDMQCDGLDDILEHPFYNWNGGYDRPTNNFYVESNDFHAFLNATDVDNNCRSVFRYNLMNNAGFGTHGVDTSVYGQRHFEYYNNVGNFNGYSSGRTSATFNMNWWIFVRGGTFVVYNNVLPALQSMDYGTKDDVHMIEMSLCSAMPAPHTRPVRGRYDKRSGLLRSSPGWNRLCDWATGLTAGDKHLFSGRVVTGTTVRGRSGARLHLG